MSLQISDMTAFDYSIPAESRRFSHEVEYHFNIRRL